MTTIKLLIVISSYLMTNNTSFGQDNEQEYFRLVKQADSLFKAKNYKKAAIAYSLAFNANFDKGLVEDRYNAACSWALSNMPDSAFNQLTRIAAKAHYDDYEHVTTDPDLLSLHQDQRWSSLIEMIKRNSLIKKD